MGGRLDDWWILADVACIVDQLCRTVEKLLALITLISSSLRVLATRTDSHDESVS
jgi:hypothetical protein